MTKQQIMDLQIQLNQQGAGLKVDGILGPKTTEAMNKAISTSVGANPALAHLTAQNSPDAILNAYNSGDWSGVVDITGKPFSDEDQKLAVEKANAALSPGFEEQQRYDESVFGRKLEDEKRGYDDYLKTSERNFQADKENLDQNAADRGVLFSGGRFQKEQNLKTMYEQDEKEKAASVGSNIGSVANDFRYKYGDSSVAKPTLSQYYQLGSNSYNPNVARGGVTPGGLSSVYSPGGQKYQGTQINANKAATQVRAASLLANKANKIVPYGYQNQF